MVALYTLTVFVGAALLFLIQPMFARQILPLLGGSPAVWNTAMAFYQAALLAGYACAHLTTRWLGVRRQAGWHLLVMLVPLPLLPAIIPASWAPPGVDTPILWVLQLMTLTVGLPFFAVSMTSPLLQRWFVATGHRDAADPYFLFAASNAGSFLALLSFPFVFERNFSVAQQGVFWAWGYGVLIVLLAACAFHLRRSTREASPSVATAPVAIPRPTAAQRGHWVLLAFVPSSLMLGATTYLSSEVAVVPLLWVVPLALYLLTFVLAFARRPRVPRTFLRRSFPILVVTLVLSLDMLVVRPIGALMLLHLAVFFVAALLCHLELASARPPAVHLTEFYLWMSLGGLLGGVFNGLISPIIFNTIAEYPLALVCACWLALSFPGDPSGRRMANGDWLWPLALGALTLTTVLLLRDTSVGADSRVLGLVFGAAAITCYFFSRRPLRFALGVGALLLAGHFSSERDARVLYAERSFFGVHQVTLDDAGPYHKLRHGVTVHGRQSLDPARRNEPLSYYHPTGPAGDVFASYARDPAARVGVVGLGTGSLTAYALPGQRWIYFEIDPAVVTIARDERYFTYLRDSAARVQIVTGDARLSLAREPDGSFDLLVLDAYSSDAIPIHLVTREALALYFRKLARGGRLAFHISNLHVDLEPVFAALARDAGAAALLRDDTRLSPRETELGKAPSIWLVAARNAAELAPLTGDSRWHPLREDPDQRVWTDSYSSLLSVLRWQ